MTDPLRQSAPRRIYTLPPLPTAHPSPHPHPSPLASQRSIQFKESHARLKKEYEEVKGALASDEVANSLDELEQKMRHHEQTVYMLSEYIDTKVTVM